MIGFFQASRASWGVRWCRERVLARLRSLRTGRLVLRDPWGNYEFGEPLTPDALTAYITIHDATFYQRVVWGGDVGAAESWMAGEWTSPRVADVVRFFIRNLSVIEQLDRGLGFFRHLASRLIHRRRKNTVEGSRRNIGAHYDLGNEFYQLFLDSTMAYSAGIFGSSNTTMHEASCAKFDRICQKLALGPKDSLIEIGTGWGGFAIHAASHYGCRVTTTTISSEQHRYACDWVEREGLSDRIEVLFQDYRKLEGKYDKLVSIEMIEAVGHDHLSEYFQVCRKLLKDDGIAVLQAILILDQRHETHLKSSDFIREYIFPGGDLPSLGSILDVTRRDTDFRMTHYEELSEHYAHTLRCWRRAFESQVDRVEAMGYSESFRRMWVYYLAYCEAAFVERQVNSAQLVFQPRTSGSRSFESLAPIAELPEGLRSEWNSEPIREVSR